MSFPEKIVYVLDSRGEVEVSGAGPERHEMVQGVGMVQQRSSKTLDLLLVLYTKSNLEDPQVS